MKTLFLTNKNGLLEATNDSTQEYALQHFSGGYIAISVERLGEITSIADIHGWKVKTLQKSENLES